MAVGEMAVVEGGASAAGANGGGSPGGGGNGTANSISGSSVTYAGGGGGGAHTGSGGAGGAGGGGAGGAPINAGTAGTANTGGGGGGGSEGNTNGGNGGTGVVIISYPTADFSATPCTGGTITTSGSNTIHTFTASGTFTVFSQAFTVGADHGSLTLSGQVAGVTRGIITVAASTTFTLTGYAVNLFTKWVNAAKNSTTWSNQSK